MSHGNGVLREQDFVFQIVKDPANPPETLLLVGFIGRSSLDKHTRVYLDVLLGSYVDVPDSAILYAREMPPPQSPLGGWYVWVKRDFDLLETVREAYARLKQIHEDYVQGLQPDTPGFGDIEPGWPQMPA